MERTIPFDFHRNADRFFLTNGKCTFKCTRGITGQLVDLTVHHSYSLSCHFQLVRLNPVSNVQKQCTTTPILGEVYWQGAKQPLVIRNALALPGWVRVNGIMKYNTLRFLECLWHLLTVVITLTYSSSG